MKGKSAMNSAENLSLSLITKLFIIIVIVVVIIIIIVIVIVIVLVLVVLIIIIIIAIIATITTIATITISTLMTWYALCMLLLSSALLLPFMFVSLWVYYHHFYAKGPSKCTTTHLRWGLMLLNGMDGGYRAMIYGSESYGISLRGYMTYLGFVTLKWWVSRNTKWGIWASKMGDSIDDYPIFLWQLSKGKTWLPW